MEWPAHSMLARYMESQVVNWDASGSICNEKCNAQVTGHLCSLPCQTSPWRVAMWGAKLESDNCFSSMEPEQEEEIMIWELKRIDYLWTMELSSLHCCSATQLCLNLLNPMDWTRILCPSLSPRVCPNSCPLSCDAIQPSHPPSPPSPPALNLSYHQGCFQWVLSPHQVTKLLEFQLQHHSFQWEFRVDFL